MLEETMTSNPRIDHRPDVLEELQTSDEFIKRIRKLRWIGMEDEAQQLEHALFRLVQVNPVLTGRFDTD
jgi:hypothetical protein